VVYLLGFALREYLRRTIYNRSWVLDIMVAMLLIVTIFFLIGQRNLSNEIVELAKQNHQLNEQVHDCTDPTGACYQASRRSNAETIAQINKVTLFAAYCANKLSKTGTLADVRKCVETAVTGNDPLQITK
jgi:hypothetical protein